VLGWDFDGELFMPVVVCDACGQRIQGLGTVLWCTEVDTGVVMPGTWHVHRSGPCMELADELEAQGGVLVLDEDLGTWLQQLAEGIRP
jgi:hypothetical protein